MGMGHTLRFHVDTFMLSWTNSILNIHRQISSPDWSPHISLKNKLRELRKIKEFSLKWPCLLILIISSLDYVCILSGENWCWSLLQLTCNMSQVKRILHVKGKCQADITLHIILKYHNNVKINLVSNKINKIKYLCWRGKGVCHLWLHCL